MVLDRIFPKITGFYLDGSPSEAEIAVSYTHLTLPTIA